MKKSIIKFLRWARLMKPEPYGYIIKTNATPEPYEGGCGCVTSVSMPVGPPGVTPTLGPYENGNIAVRRTRSSSSLPMRTACH